MARRRNRERVALAAAGALSAALAAALPASSTAQAVASAVDGRRAISLDVTVCGSPSLPTRAAASAVRFTPGRGEAAAPWMAKLEMVERLGPDGAMTVSNCGGVAIDRDWLLTAGHCVGSADWSSLRATLGVRDLEDSAAVRRRGAVALCPARFDSTTLAHDLALVRLETPLPNGFPIVRLATSREARALRPGGRALSAGWSRVEPQRLSQTLRLAHVRVIDPGRAPDGVIVAGPERDESSLCVGESGGPLVANFGAGSALVGVFSSVDAYRDRATGALIELCSGFEARSYFTPVAAYRDWIGRAIAACEADLARCLGPATRPASLRVGE
ncbi:MAG: trypsin-like serine protease [Pseudomonadota bacterium]